MGASQPGYFQSAQSAQSTQALNVNINSQFIQPRQQSLSYFFRFQPSQSLHVNLTSQFPFTNNQTSKDCPNSCVIQISVISRPTRLFLNHSALLVESMQQKNGKQIKETHLIEYMNDSQAHVKQINEFVQKGDTIKIENANWKKKEFYYDSKLNQYNVCQIKQMMQQLADNKGQYSLYRNNCNIVASKLLNEIKNKNI